MRWPYALLLLLHAPLTLAGVFSTETLQPYPADWPSLPPSSASCREIAGHYADPDRWRWAHEEFPGQPRGAKQGGVREAAWVVFGFAPASVQAERPGLAAKSIQLDFDAEGQLVVTYRRDQQAVATRTFPRSQLDCQPDGLQLTIAEHSGQVLDKLPNTGQTSHRLRLVRQGDYLYVEQQQATQARVFGFVPQSFRQQFWFRFPAFAAP